VIVHDGKSRDIGDLAATVWYPVWDAGLQLDHSVRTVKEAAKVADNDMKAALGLLDARFIAGDEDLFTKLVERVTDGWRSKVRDRLGTLEELVRERHDDAHEVAFALEPDIKNGLGGTRDLTILGVLAQVSPVYVPDPTRARRCSTFGSRCNVGSVGASDSCSSTRTSSPWIWATRTPTR